MTVTLLIIIGLTLFIIIFAFILKKRLKLLILKLKYGKYSFNYLRQFKKYAKKSPFPYCFKDDIVPYLKEFTYRKKTSDQFKSEKEMIFENTSYSLNLSDFTKSHGTPDCFNAFSVKGSEIRVFGYKCSKFNTESKTLFYFIDDIFFMGEYLIENISKFDYYTLAGNILLENNVDSNKSTSHFYIDSGEDSTIYFTENGFTLSIKYIDNTNEKIREIMR